MADKEKFWQDSTMRLLLEFNDLQQHDYLLSQTYSATSNELNKLKKRSLERISIIQLGDTSFANCDTLAGQFNDYIILSEKEKQDCDNIVTNKSKQIEKLIRLHQADSAQAIGCTIYLGSVITKYDALYSDYQQRGNVKHNLLSVAIACQYYEQLKTFAAGGGLDLTLKNDYKIGYKLLFTQGSQRIHEINGSIPIHLKKR